MDFIIIDRDNCTSFARRLHQICVVGAPLIRCCVVCPLVFSLPVSAYEDFVQESSLVEWKLRYVNALRIVETLSGSHMSRQYPPSFPDVDGAVQAETNLSQVKKCGIISHFKIAKNYQESTSR